MNYRFAQFLLTSIWLTICHSAAEAAAHLGLLANTKMTIVLENANKTQRLLLPEQKLSACWPYDIAPRNLPSGTSLCTLETPQLLNGTIHMVAGPDLYCPYTKEEFCDIQKHAPSK